MIFEPAAPRDEILRTCRLLMAPGDVVEVRAPKTARHGTVSGYFNSHELLADAVLELDGGVSAIYCTLNPCNPALLARAANRLQSRASVTTSDADVVRRRWLLIDLDPVRPSGISSTDHEHGRAITTALGTWDDLRGAGFPDPVIADSGNGAHLLIPLRFPNTAQATDLIKHVLAGIAARSAPEDISVDQTVFNASRITKLYGTMACKGDDLPERPHRRSRLLEVPDVLTPLELT